MIPALQGDRTAMLQTVLPEDPEDGQVVTMPEGQTVGGANVINAQRGSYLLGSISQVAPVFNSSGKYEATRVASCLEILKGDVIRVVGYQHNFVSLKFIEGFGWQGYKTDGNPLVLMDKHMKVLAAFPLGLHSGNHYLYEKVCLQLIREGEKTHAKPTSNTSTAQTGNTTPSGSRTSITRGSSSGAPRTDPSTGSCSGASRKPTLIDGGDGITE